MHLRVAEGGDITVPLQALLVEVHRQGDIDGDDQLQVDLGLGQRWSDPQPLPEKQSRNEAELQDFQQQARHIGQSRMRKKALEAQARTFPSPQVRFDHEQCQTFVHRIAWVR